MISREEAERLTDKPILKSSVPDLTPTLLYEWSGDISILKFPDIASKILTEEALFVMHSGCLCKYGKYDPTSLYGMSDYYEYIDRLKLEIQSFLGRRPVISKKSVWIWVEANRKRETLQFLGVDRNSVILVPTSYLNDPTGIIGPSAEPYEAIIQMKKKEFFVESSKYVRLGKLTGEARDACVSGLEDYFSGLIKTQIIDYLTHL